MKVLLVIPKRDSCFILPAPDIGLAYVARAALRAGADVEVLDAHLEDIGAQKFKAWLQDKKFDLVGFKCLSIDLANCLEYCRLVKELLPTTVTVLGGPHPTALPESVLQNKQVDYVIRGEGEAPLFSLLKGIMGGQANLDKVAGLSYRAADGEKIVSNPVTLEEKLDDLGFPAWQLFKLEKYPLLPGSNGRFLPVITTRGCPNECTFCGFNATYGRKVRTRTPKNVLEEMKWLVKNFNIQKISIFDDNFLFHRDHAIKICRLFKNERLPVDFDVPQGIRIDRIDEALIKELAQAGCSYLGIGVESGSQKTLDLVKKGTNINQIKEKIDLIKKNSRIKMTGFFIIGFPHETEADILETINFSLQLKLDFAAFTLFTPFPGTALFSQMIKEGYFRADQINWADLLLDKATFKHKHISAPRLKQLQKQAYLRFYLRPSRLGFFWQIIKQGSLVSYFKRFYSIIKNR